MIILLKLLTMAPLCYLLLNEKGNACVGMGKGSAVACLAAHNARVSASRPWWLRAEVRGFTTLKEARVFQHAWENGFSPRTRSMRDARKVKGVARYRAHFDSMSVLCKQNNVVRASYTTEREFMEALLNLQLSMDKWQHLMPHLYPMPVANVPAPAIQPAPVIAPALQLVVAAGAPAMGAAAARAPASPQEYEDSIMDPGDAEYIMSLDTEAEEETA